MQSACHFRPARGARIETSSAFDSCLTGKTFAARRTAVGRTSAPGRRVALLSTSSGRRSRQAAKSSSARRTYLNPRLHPPNVGSRNAPQNVDVALHFPELARTSVLIEVNPIKKLYQRLSDVGLTRAFVKKTALPSWWDDEVAANPSGYAQGLLLLSRHLGLDLVGVCGDRLRHLHRHTARWTSKPNT